MTGGEHEAYAGEFAARRAALDLPAVATAVKDDLSRFTLRLRELMGMTD